MDIITIFGGILSSNVYIIKNGNKSIIIDAGIHYMKILKAIKKAELDYDDICLIIITHNHFDHCSEIAYLKDVLINAKILIHENDADLLKRGDFIMPNGLWKMTSLFSYFGNLIKKNTLIMHYRSVIPDIVMKGKEYDLTDFGYSKAKIIHTPGHSDGSISLILGDKAFVGDLMYGRFKGYLGYYAVYGEDVNVINKQWLKLLGEGCKVFYPGHGTVIESKWIKKKLNKVSKKIE